MSYEYPNLIGNMAGGDSSIFLGDGTLSGNRTLTGGGNTLTFTDLSNFYTQVSQSGEGFAQIYMDTDAANATNGQVLISASNGGSFDKQGNILVDCDNSDAQMRFWVDGALGNTNRVEVRMEPTTGITLHENTTATPGRIRLGLNSSSQPPILNTADTIIGMDSSTRYLKRIEKDKFLGFDSDLTSQFRVFWANGASKMLFQDYSPNTVTLDIDSGFVQWETVNGAVSSSITLEPNEISLSFDSTAGFTINGSQGTSHQVLASNGSNSPPVWEDVSGANIPAFASDSAAGTGGLTAGDLWKTASHATLPDNVVLVKS